MLTLLTYEDPNKLSQTLLPEKNDMARDIEMYLTETIFRKLKKIDITLHICLYDIILDQLENVPVVYKEKQLGIKMPNLRNVRLYLQ